MASSDSIMMEGMGPQVGYGMPFSGPYSNVYGVTPSSDSAQGQYWDAINRGYENQSRRLLMDAFQKNGNYVGGDLSTAVVYNPQTGQYSLDMSKLDPNIRKTMGTGPEADARIQREFQNRLNDTNEDRMQARQQLEGLAQQQAATRARTEQQMQERAGFQQELQRYNAPNLMGQMINPAIQQAGNQVMANANAAGMAGGSMAQAANRRAAMSGFGQQAANVVPQAAVQQADQNFQWQKAREGMINNYYNMQNQRAQQDMTNQMAWTGFKRGMEQYEHSRSREDMEAAGSFLGNVGALAGNAAPFLKGGGGK